VIYIPHLAQLWPAHEVPSKICPAGEASRGARGQPSPAPSPSPLAFAHHQLGSRRSVAQEATDRLSSEQASPGRANIMSRPSRSLHRTNQRQTIPSSDSESSPRSAVRRPARPHVADTHIPHSPTLTHMTGVGCPRWPRPANPAQPQRLPMTPRHQGALPPPFPRPQGTPPSGSRGLLPDVSATPLCAPRAFGTCPFFFSSPARPMPHASPIQLRLFFFFGSVVVVSSDRASSGTPLEGLPRGLFLDDAEICREQGKRKKKVGFFSKESVLASSSESNCSHKKRRKNSGCSCPDSFITLPPSPRGYGNHPTGTSPGGTSGGSGRPDSLRTVAVPPQHPHTRHRHMSNPASLPSAMARSLVLSLLPHASTTVPRVDLCSPSLCFHASHCIKLPCLKQRKAGGQSLGLPSQEGRGFKHTHSVFEF
jgi:hypothetical protein